MSMAEEYLEYLDSQVEAEQEGFVIDNDDKADWALRKIAQAEKRIQERAEFVETEMAKLQAWQSQQDAQDKRTIEFMTGLLKIYFGKLRESGTLGKKKSYKLPNGTLAVRKKQPKLAYDADAFIAWASKEAPEYVATILQPRWGEFKKRIKVIGRDVVDTETGETIKFVTVEEPESESFSVKTS